ncbi:MAG TPA: tetratricopeptide repeat-containing protein, partial [Blastocatellia bacterium]|nr:tetratricopeptide repeat-containing protein [Blastocatellia bacterium]
MLNPLFRPSASSIKSSSTLSRMCLLSVLLMIGLGADWLSKAGAQNGQADQEQTMTQEVMTLEVGKPIECKFLGAKNYTFQVFARKKQYIRLLVEEIGVNVTVGVWDSSKKLFEVENTLISGWGRERVIWIAEKETTFRVELRRANPQGRNGKCKVMLAELRFATRRDQAQVEADDWVKDAISLAKRRKQTEALELFKRALVSYEENLGPAHPDYCFALSRIAAQYYGRGQARLTEQETLAWKMLSALEKQPSPDDLEIAQTLVLLSDVSGANGDFSKARELLQQSVSVIERHHGVSHPALISPLAATASLARSLNDYEQAAQIYRRLQGIEKEVSGPEHPNVLYADYEIAYLYLLNRDFLRAENLYLKLLESLKKSVASDHPRIVGVLVDLSKLHRDQNDYVK